MQEITVPTPGELERGIAVAWRDDHHTVLRPTKASDGRSVVVQAEQSRIDVGAPSGNSLPVVAGPSRSAPAPTPGDEEPVLAGSSAPARPPPPPARSLPAPNLNEPSLEPSVGPEIASSARANVLSTLTTATPATASAPAAANANNPLLWLPQEILDIIFDYANWPAARALRQTCHAFHAHFSVLAMIRKGRAYRDELLEVDNSQFPAPCYGCLRTLPRASFPTRQPTKFGPVGRRRCTTCLVAAREMSAGAEYVWRGEQWVHCSRCGRTALTKCWFGATERPGLCGLCRMKAGAWAKVKWVLQPRLGTAIALLIVLGVVCAAMQWRTIARLWWGSEPYDRGLLAYGFFSATYTVFMNVVYLVFLVISAHAAPGSRLSKWASKWLHSGHIAFEFAIEWTQLFACLCMPFAVTHIASVPLLGWSGLCWASMCAISIFRIFEEC